MISNKKIKVAVGMSGGVDSTMAAFILKKQGFDVIGLTMVTWDGKHSGKKTQAGCYGPGQAANVKDAKKAAAMLGIPHRVINLKKEFRKEILSYFRKEYASGRTPNPCVICNRKIKFGQLIGKALKSGILFDYFATGHYARIYFDKKKNIYFVKKGADKSKDQSYFLYRLKQSQLKRVIFPLGGKMKKDVRKLAEKNGFGYFARKKESQNFAGCGSYAELLPKGKEGNIVDFEGKILGKHKGIANYTPGQRRNLNLGGLKEPYYVLEIDAANNSIIAGPRKLAFSSKVTVKNLNWVISPRSVKNSVKAAIRYGGKPANARFIFKNKNRAVLKFKKPQFAVAPGQSIVFYEKDLLLGGGIISK